MGDRYSQEVRGAISEIERFCIVKRQASAQEIEPLIQNGVLAAQAMLAAPRAEQQGQVEALNRFLIGLPADIVSDGRFHLTFLVIQIFCVRAASADALPLSANLLQLARGRGRPTTLRKALTYRGIVLSDTGDVAAAIELYEEALQLAQDLGDVSAESVVWNNLGVALQEASLYQDARACYERAVNLLPRDASLIPVRARILANIAYCALYTDDIVAGLKAARAAVMAMPQPTGQTDLVLCANSESYYARLLLEIDDVERAREHCARACHFAEESVSSRAVVPAMIAEGLYEIHVGMVDSGMARLVAALEQARAFQPILRDVLVVLIKANERAGRVDAAQAYLRELTDHLRTTRQHNARLYQGEPIGALAQGKKSDLKVEATGLSTVSQMHEHLRGGDGTGDGIGDDVRQRQRLVDARIEMLERLAVAAELRDDVTGEHLYRVGRLASLLAVEAGCDRHVCEMINVAARLHDIGKIGIPDAVLRKQGRFTRSERGLMMTHTTIGAETLADSDMPQVRMAEEIARGHHEWWNGEGYPHRLKGEEIALSARITALVDVFDALTHRRHYKQSWSVYQALEQIRSERGTHFDPRLTDLLLELVPRLQREHGDLDAYLGQAAKGSKFLKARNNIAKALREFRGDKSDFQRFDVQR
jgi:putative two-component system response regulator